MFFGLAQRAKLKAKFRAKFQYLIVDTNELITIKMAGKDYNYYNDDCVECDMIEAAGKIAAVGVRHGGKWGM